MKLLYMIAKIKKFKWIIETDLDKNEAMNLYKQGLLYKAPVDRYKISGTFGKDLELECFSISLKGLSKLFIQYPGTVVNTMKKELFDNIFNGNMDIYKNLIYREKRWRIK